jgi:hypothetical protein
MPNTPLMNDVTRSIGDGIRKFIRSLGLNMESYQIRQMSDENDLIDALQSIKYFFHSAIALHGSLNPAAMDDTRKDMEEYLLKGLTKQEDTLKWSRNAGMYLLVVEPTITLLCMLDPTTIHSANAIVDDVISKVKNTDAYSDHSDAVVAREQIRLIVSKYRAAHLAADKTKKVRKTKKKYASTEYGEDESESESESQFKYNTNESRDAIDFN